jgi:hypothetical protein
MTTILGKKGKEAPPYWFFLRLLGKMRLEFREHDRGTPRYHVTIFRFGIVIKFSVTTAVEMNYPGWDVLEYNFKWNDAEKNDFNENLMWLLISKGYFAYLRDPEAGGASAYRILLMESGWATKILEKRLSYWNNEPRHRFKIEQHKQFLNYPLSRLITHYPDLFDSLY